MNVPEEVVRAAGLDRKPAYEELLASPEVGRWLVEEHQRAVEWLRATESRLAGLRGHRGARVLRIFARSIASYARRLPSLHPRHFGAPHNLPAARTVQST